MKNFYLYIFILSCFIIIVSYWNTYVKEGFNVDKQSFILLGDSIFKNDAYVSNGKSVDELLIERTNGKTTCLAVDHSKIKDIYDQIDKIPEDLNTSSSTLFLSVGGNDILSYYVEKTNDPSDTSFLDTMFKSYQEVIKSIQKRFPNVNIVIVDIYYPDSSTYKKYHSIIHAWNTMIYDYARKNNLSVLKISRILTKPSDFSFGVEPSALGSGKLVDTILSSY